MGAFENLGQALRWLRNRQQRKQYEIAAAAGITKAMLSAYETGKQNPSVETLDKLLAALDADLSDLHEALVLNQGGRRSPVLGPSASMSALAAAGERSEHLPEEWDRPLSQLLGALQALVRQVHEELQATRATPPRATPPSDGASGPPGPRRIDTLPPTDVDEEE